MELVNPRPLLRGEGGNMKNAIMAGEIKMYTYSRNGISQEMPILEITVDTVNCGKKTAYLSPFRRRGFQVSSTFDGRGDLGSVYESEDMKDILRLMGRQYFQKYCYAQAVVAINRFANYGGETVSVSTTFANKRKLEDFVKKVLDYVETSI